MSDLPVSAKETKSLLNKCFQHAIDLNMLTKDQITDGVVRVSEKSARSYGGMRYKNGIRVVYVSLNIGGSVISPTNDRMKGILNSNISMANRNTQRVRNWRNILNKMVNGLYVFNEYTSYADDKHIGTLASSNPVDCMAALVAHEVAHAVNYVTGNPEFKGRNHGNGFKKVYRILRAKMLENVETAADTVEKAVEKAAPTTRTRAKKGQQDRMITFLEATQPRTRKEALAMARENGWKENTMSMVFHKWNTARKEEGRI